MSYDETTIAFWTLTIATFCGFFFISAMEDAEGAVVQSTFNETDYSYPLAQEIIKATHTKDDMQVVSYTPNGDALVVAYRERGGGWDYTVLHDSGTANSYKTGGVINTLNNSVVILVSYITGSYHDLHLYIKFPADDWDTWTVLDAYTGSPGRYAADIAINDTDQICVMSTYTSSSYFLRYWIYDFPSLTKVFGGVNGDDAGGAAAGGFYSVQVLANATGKFHFFFNLGTQHWWRDIAESVPLTAINSANYYISMVAVLPNDRFVAAGHYARTGRPYIYYQDEHMDTSWTRSWIEVATRSYESEAMGISISQDSTLVNLISYCNSDERITTWGAQFDASEVTWQGSQSDTGVGDADDIVMNGNFGGLWPEHPSTGIKWTRPTAGWAVLGRDESGGTDELDLISNGVDWTVDLTTADPEITTATLPDATFEAFWEHTLTKSGGTSPFEWTLLVGPAWMSLGSSNGTLYGTPDGTGTETVRAKLADAVPRYDEEEWTLTINPASSGEGEDEPTSATFIYDDVGEMWMLLALTAVFVAIARTWKMATYRRDQG